MSSTLEATPLILDAPGRDPGVRLQFPVCRNGHVPASESLG